MTSDLLRDVPKDKYDTRAAEAMAARGFPEATPVLPELLEWIRDGNWPVARVLAPFLATAGAPLVPHAENVLRGGDDTWKYYLLQDVVAKSTSLAALLRSDLERLSCQPTRGEAAEELPSMADAILSKLG